MSLNCERQKKRYLIEFRVFVFVWFGVWNLVFAIVFLVSSLLNYYAGVSACTEQKKSLLKYRTCTLTHTLTQNTRAVCDGLDLLTLLGEMTFLWNQNKHH